VCNLVALNRRHLTGTRDLLANAGRLVLALARIASSSSHREITMTVPRSRSMRKTAPFIPSV
jgi:hypothetical protein